MAIYAGIDEAGYGPMFGPLTLGCVVLDVPVEVQGARMWEVLGRSVCRTLSEKRAGGGTLIAVNDSKKLHTKASGVKHLEMGALCFARVGGVVPGDFSEWLELLGETAHREAGFDDALPWYEKLVTEFERLPKAVTAGEIAVGAGVLKREMLDAGCGVAGFRGAVIFEDRFNRLVSQTRSKAAVSFSYVASFIDEIWRSHATRERGGATVVVDRQSGRTRYRELLAQVFPDAMMRVADETTKRSVYEVTDQTRRMRVSFEVEAEQTHMPVALASMTAKYNREMLMGYFQRYFAAHAPKVKPTAGYGADAKRFWKQIEPVLVEMRIASDRVRRLS